MANFYILMSVFVCVLFAYIPIGHSLKCFTCRSDLDPSCGRPFDNASIPADNCEELGPNRYDINDPNIPYVCRTVEFNLKNDSKQYIHRFCGKEDKDVKGNKVCSDRQLQSWGAEIQKVENCTSCDTNYCLPRADQPRKDLPAVFTSTGSIPSLTSSGLYLLAVLLFCTTNVIYH